MKYFIVFCIIIISIFYADEKNNNIGFKYGFLGQMKSNPDSTVVLSDGYIIHTNDKVRINIGYVKESSFYLIYIGSAGEVMMLYPDPLEGKANEEAKLDTIYASALPWSPLSDPPGYETFYFINSRAPLTELTKLMRRYEKAPEKAQVKLTNRIQEMIDDLDPSVKGDLALIPNRLDKPMVGGVAFRGDDDDNLKDMSLTHTCTGSNGVAFQKIVLNHQ
jgi:hypothetical protein